MTPKPKIKTYSFKEVFQKETPAFKLLIKAYKKEMKRLKSKKKLKMKAIKAWAILSSDFNPYSQPDGYEMLVYLRKKDAEKKNEGMDENIVKAEIKIIQI